MAELGVWRASALREQTRVAIAAQAGDDAVSPYVAPPGDVDYLSPSEAWVAGPFREYWLRVLGSLELAWQEDFDCNRLADGWMWFANACHGRENTGVQGIAMGAVWYRVSGEPGREHAIGCYLLESGQIGFWEPNPAACRRVALSSAELASIYWVRW